MDLKEIKNILWTINAYEKWTFDFARKEVVGYTCFYWDDDDCKLFKPKCWNKCGFRTFLKVFSKKKYRENFFLP